MMKRKCFYSIFVIALIIVVLTPCAPVGATELQGFNEEATLTDAKINEFKDEAAENYLIEGEPVRTGEGISIEDAVLVDVAARNYDKYRNKFVYQKLSTAEKRFYDALEQMAKTYINTNVDATMKIRGNTFIDGIAYSGLTELRAAELVMIFEYQNPQYYFLEKHYSFDANNDKIYVGIYNDFANGNNRASCTERFFNNVDSVVNRVKTQNGDYNRAKAVHDEICNLAVYDNDWSCEYNDSAWSVFVLSETVCLGYSKAFTMIANACGIETVGDTTDFMIADYAWNRSYVDGNWYFVDCAWDDKDQYGKNDYSFFLVGKNTLDTLDYAYMHFTGEQYEGLLPDCPYDYSKNNPPIGEVPPTDGLLEASVFVAKADRYSFLGGVTTNLDDNTNLEFCWYATVDQGNSWKLIKDWTINDEWLSWTPEKFGEYEILVRVREKGKSNYVEARSSYSYHPFIKGKCQMPYTGPGGGYLIGVESYENPNQSFQYEMLILDCTLLAQGKDAWIYTTGKCKVSEGNSLWSIWQPGYGYYWTLFRVYDGNNKLLDEACYGFVNAY